MMSAVPDADEEDPGTPDAAYADAIRQAIGVVTSMGPPRRDAEGDEAARLVHGQVAHAQLPAHRWLA